MLILTLTATLTTTCHDVKQLYQISNCCDDSQQDAACFTSVDVSNIKRKIMKGGLLVGWNPFDPQIYFEGQSIVETGVGSTYFSNVKNTTVSVTQDVFDKASGLATYWGTAGPGLKSEGLNTFENLKWNANAKYLKTPPNINGVWKYNLQSFVATLFYMDSYSKFVDGWFGEAYRATLPNRLNALVPGVSNTVLVVPIHDEYDKNVTKMQMQSYTILSFSITSRSKYLFARSKISNRIVVSDIDLSENVFSEGNGGEFDHDNGRLLILSYHTFKSAEDDYQRIINLFDTSISLTLGCIV